MAAKARGGQADNGDDHEAPAGALEDAYVMHQAAALTQETLLNSGVSRRSRQYRRLERTKRRAFEALNDAALAVANAHDDVPTEYWGHKPRTRVKGCYELTGWVVMNQKAPVDTEVVFGHWQSQSGYEIPHVWLHLSDGRIWEPVSATLDDADAQIERHGLREYSHLQRSRFSLPDAWTMMLKYKALGDFAVWETESSV